MKKTLNLFSQAAEDNSAIVFPNKIEEISILQTAIEMNPSDAKAHYYLGNLWYDKRQYDEAIACWEESIKINKNFATAYRNLAIAYYNKRNDKQKALQYLEKAFALDDTDARVFMELDQLYKLLNKPFKERLQLLEKYAHLVDQRDDLYIERITLYNNLKDYKTAKQLLAARPWSCATSSASTSRCAVSSVSASFRGHRSLRVFSRVRARATSHHLPASASKVEGPIRRVRQRSRLVYRRCSEGDCERERDDSVCRRARLAPRGARRQLGHLRRPLGRTARRQPESCRREALRRRRPTARHGERLRARLPIRVHRSIEKRW